jgi:hypothetical protein
MKEAPQKVAKDTLGGIQKKKIADIGCLGSLLLLLGCIAALIYLHAFWTGWFIPISIAFGLIFLEWQQRLGVQKILDFQQGVGAQKIYPVGLVIKSSSPVSFVHDFKEFSWPRICPCCLAPADSQIGIESWRQEYTSDRPGKGGVTTTTNIPCCNACRSHIELGQRSGSKSMVRFHIPSFILMVWGLGITLLPMVFERSGPEYFSRRIIGAVVFAMPFLVVVALEVRNRRLSKARIRQSCVSNGAPLSVDLVAHESSFFIRCKNASYADLILRLHPEAGVAWDTRESQGN